MGDRRNARDQPAKPGRTAPDANRPATECPNDARTGVRVVGMGAVRNDQDMNVR
jgi:hypothetical protein